MSVMYNFEKPNDYFLVDVHKRISKALADRNYRQRYIEVFKIDKKSLSKIVSKNSKVFADDLILKIDYLLKLEEGD